MSRRERRRYSKAEKARLLEGLGTWTGSLASYAASMGVAQTTLSRWVGGDRRPHRRVSVAGPTMLEVVGPAAPKEVPEPRVVSSGRVRLNLRGNVSLEFEVLPPAAWVAEFAGELHRC